VQMKNWEPFVFGPAFAMERVPGPPCAISKFSSSNLLPKIDFPPVPVHWAKTHPDQIRA